MKRIRTSAPIIVLAISAAGCSAEETVQGEVPGARVEIKVAPLLLPGLTDACYDIAVYNAALPANGELVWSKTGICAHQYGDSQASIAYVGACDASGEGGQRDNSVRLILRDLCTGGECVVPGPGATSLPAADWANPCPAPGGCVQSRPCRQDSDTPVTFDLTVLRSAEQGFFDMAVNFADIFCSAKLDCVGDGGGDITLLYDPTTRERGTTVVLGFACTSGANQDTYLYMNDVTVTCYDDQESVVSVTTIDPSEGPGNMGPAGSLFFETASYRGSEQLAPYAKCYWNLALGIRESQLTDRCVLSLRATASDEPLVGDAIAAGNVYPVVTWSVDLNEVPGDLDCGKHPLNGTGSQVQTSYSTMAGEPFAHFIACEDPLNAGGSPGRRVCDGQIAGVTDVVTFTSTDTTLTASVGGVTSPAYPLPDGYGLGGCCLDPCCGE